MRKITILGCGSSAGVPRPSPEGWGACDPENPKNRRRRCSILVEQSKAEGRTCILVDTSPDLREQLLSVGAPKIDAVLYTHEHADHTHGIDDLRPQVVDTHQCVPIYATNQSMALLHQRFGYCFTTPPGSSYSPILIDNLIQPGEPLTLNGAGGPIEAEPIPLRHGDIESLAFRFGNAAYAPDVSKILESSLNRLMGLDILILDALRYRPHPTHFSVQEALDHIAILKPKRAVLTNLHVDLDYEVLKAQLPANVEPAYDGMVLMV